ncbi:histidinol-phosphate transaminase [Paenibacillus sp. OSY-SE]|uniref:histidinol-phosphate transaminase n=1 Tax=Paenibacillus sp. OSY-SE TaxID=1196323 RepID=UPI00030BDDC7|nr:histidinol-phosphate transaminase [Paenibacillus sp. OSY-SE]
MSKYWSGITARLVPYVPGEQPRDKKYIKLNTNENPYPPSPKVLEAITGAVNADLRLYPDPTCDNLRRTVADYCGLSERQVFIGNGSDEILAFSFVAFFNPGEPILFPDITYSFYKVYANLYGLSYQTVPLDDEFNIPMEPFHAANGGVIIPNPNAPTAKAVPVDFIRSVLENNLERAVIIDEAYIDFGGESAVRLVAEYPNLLVIQTLSKSRSLAGLRVGIALGSEELIEGLERVKNSFNSYTLDRLALSGAIAAFQDEDYFQEATQKVIRTREMTMTQLRELGCKVLDSKANFVFITHPAVPAKQLLEELRAEGILVRYFAQPRIDNYLRVSIGTDEDMERFIQTFQMIISRHVNE